MRLERRSEGLEEAAARRSSNYVIKKPLAGAGRD
jgi:hypothetical protein